MKKCVKSEKGLPTGSKTTHRDAVLQTVYSFSKATKHTSRGIIIKSFRANFILVRFSLTYPRLHMNLEQNFISFQSHKLLIVQQTGSYIRQKVVYSSH
jgi:hypothetical protein